MAPKKTILIVLSFLFMIGLTSAALDFSKQNVWLNQDPTVKFNSTCGSSVSVGYPGGATVSGDFTSDSSYDYKFSNFNETGAYEFSVECSDSENEYGVVQAGNVSLSLEGVPEDNEEIEYGENFDFSVDIKTDNLDMDAPDLGLDIADSSDFERVDNSGVNPFTVSAPDTGSAPDVYTLTVEDNRDGFDLSASKDIELEPYSIRNVVVKTNGEVVDDNTVKYRHLSSLKLNLKVEKRGKGKEGLKADRFLFDGSSEWFTKTDEGSGNYNLEINGKPVYEEGDGEDKISTDSPVPLSIELDTEGGPVDIVERLTVEEDVEFSGRVADISNNKVNTQFKAIVDRENGDSSKVVSFNNWNSDVGRFSQYFETESVDMKMKFDKKDSTSSPRATIGLASMDVGKEDAGDISYNYYSDPKSNSNIDEDLSLRPINLVSFVSNYPFEADSVNTFARMSYDTSNVDPLEIEVYECSQWTFDAKQCSSEWEKIDNDDVDLKSGSTWKAEVPIDPLTSDRFATDEGVLQNAYLIGVPRGVGSSLTLEEGSVDGLPGRIQAGKEFSFSGTVIDSSTGEPVENADVSIELVSDGNDPVTPEDGISTDEDGEFEYTDSIDDSGEYSVSLDVSKNPYESFTYEEDSTMEVYYETGLSVSSEDNVDIQLGESSSIDFEVENVGQSEVEDFSIDPQVSGISEEYYTWNTPSVNSLDSGESVTATLQLNIPSDGEVTPGQKTISLSVSGSSAGESVENSASVYANVPQEQENTSQEAENTDTQEQENDGSFSVPDGEEVSQMTGEFIESQSDMNLALGIILLFGAILAVTVRKRKDSDGDRNGRMNARMGGNGAAAAGGARGNVQRPDVSPSDEEDEDQDEQARENDKESDNTENEESESSDGSDSDSDAEFVCDTCGEGFDTESGLKLHRQALH